MPTSLCLRTSEPGAHELVIVRDGEQIVLPLSSDQVSFLSVQFALAQASERDRLARLLREQVHIRRAGESPSGK